MSVPVTPAPRRIRTPRPRHPAALLAPLLAAGAGGGAVSVLAPPGARPWVAGTVAVAWVWLALTVLLTTRTARRLHRAVGAADDELRGLRAQGTRAAAESAQLADVTLPSVLKRLREGGSARGAGVMPPSEPALRRALQLFTDEITAAEVRARAAEAGRAAAAERLAHTVGGLDRLTGVTLPAAVERLGGGASADTVLAELERPDDERLRAVLENTVRALAFSERRAAAAREVSTKVLSRVQAKAVSTLADLRDMQDRHSEEVFGDLLRLDHNTSQLGLLTDRLALLMGGRTSRAWNKPIVMESILRGAVGRIAAYRRVRLHSSSTASIVGYAAEGVMHLLAELMDNAANFSPPIDEVHVYVEERTAGLVVTVEDSGLKMPEAALRRAEEAVSGRDHDLARLQSTRLGLVVVGLLAVKYRMSVSFRPSSRGGTGVVVLFPPELLHQTRHTVGEEAAALSGTAALPPEPTGTRAPEPRPAAAGSPERATRAAVGRGATVHTVPALPASAAPPSPAEPVGPVGPRPPLPSRGGGTG
ncbi:sensor histidine kinase, partial [Streptomyces clavuligerus]